MGGVGRRRNRVHLGFVPGGGETGLIGDFEFILDFANNQSLGMGGQQQLYAAQHPKKWRVS